MTKEGVKRMVKDGRGKRKGDERREVRSTSIRKGESKGDSEVAKPCLQTYVEERALGSGVSSSEENLKSEP